MEQQIKQWIQLDKRKKLLYREMQQLCEQQRVVEQAIFERVPKDNWGSFNIALTSGKRIHMCQETTYMPISHTLLRKALQSWRGPFEPNACFQHILSQREPKKRWVLQWKKSAPKVATNGSEKANS